MFDQLFRYPAVVRRHRDGPFAHERATYLAGLASRGSATETLLKYARYCLAIAHVVQATPPDRSFTTSEIDGLARTWAAARVHDRGTATPRRPLCEFRAIATTFLKLLGRLTPPPKASCPYAREVDDFVAEQRDRLRSPTTCRVRRWQTSDFCPILAGPTVIWQRSHRSMWTPISSTSRPAGVASRSDRPHWPCGSGSAIVKRKAGFGPDWRRQFLRLAFIGRKVYPSGQRGTPSPA